MKKSFFSVVLLALLPFAMQAQADQKLINKAHKGNTAAMVLLGECYENGAGVALDSAQALKWFQRAAEQGDGEGWLRVSQYYLRGTLLPADTARYLAIRQEWADKGLPNGLTALGVAYECGYGVKADTARALELYEQAVKKGSSWGYEVMGNDYATGELGVQKDVKKAAQYFEKSYKLGNQDGASRLAFLYMSEGDYKAAWKWANEGMRWGDPDAITVAAQMHASGLGVAKDEAKAQQMMEELVGNHHSLRYSQALAGILFMYPDSAALRDSAKAIRLWNAGDAFGSSACQLELAKVRMQQGDYPGAYAYCRKVAQKELNDGYQGDACYMAALLRYDEEAGMLDKKEVIAWLTRGADKFGSAACAMELATLYEGDEDYSDMPMAVKYYRRTADLGNTDGLLNLGKMYAKNGNTERAQECFQEMVDKGETDGYFWMAMLYDMGEDGKNCLRTLEAGDKKGSKMCAEGLGTIYEYGLHDKKVDNKKAAAYYAKAGTPKAKYREGLLYLNGEVGKKSDKDIAQGLELIRQSAEAGYTEAIYALGYAYETGQYVDSVDHVKALSYYSRLAENNIPGGQFKMGLYYELGDGGLPADSVKAIEYYQKAADQGHGEAMCYLGDFYRIGRFLPLDRREAFNLYMKAHEVGEEAGTYYVGRSYLEGCGVDIDTAAAIPYLREAAAKGVGNAAFRIAEFYNYGQGGLPHDSDSAAAYYMAGHRGGSGDASYYIGSQLLREGAYDKAVEYLYVAAKRGNTGGMTAFALCLQEGLGIDADPVTAHQIFENVVRREDNPVAYCQLGIGCLQGVGCPEDEALGKAYLDTAANLGNTLAMYNLGQCYLNGYGCPTDTTQAIFWLEKAADNANINAINAIGDVYEAKGDFKNAALYYEKAVAAGSMQGYCNLGYCYEQGQGVVLSSKKAFELYMVAAENGFNRGYLMVANCYLNGIYVEENAAEALAWLTKAAENGSVTAMYYAGTILEEGADGVKADPKKAKAWYKKAADAGYAPAAAALGRMK